jgi:hypothetical protein
MNNNRLPPPLINDLTRDHYSSTIIITVNRTDWLSGQEIFFPVYYWYQPFIPGLHLYCISAKNNGRGTMNSQLIQPLPLLINDQLMIIALMALLSFPIIIKYVTIVTPGNL